MEIIFYLLLAILGLITGSLTGLIAASCVMLVVPVLTIFFGVDVHTAIGTSLMIDAITSVAVSYSYYKEGNTDLRSGLWLAGGAVIGSQIGVLLAQATPENSLRGIFGITTMLIGLFMVFKRSGIKEDLEQTKDPNENRLDEPIRFQAKWQQIVLSLLIGGGLGIASGLTGAGGGLVIVLVLNFVMGYSLHLAIGTATLIMAIIATSGSIGYALNGDINVLFGLIIGISSVIGGIVGSRFANKLNEDALKKMLGIIFLSLGILMIFLALLS